MQRCENNRPRDLDRKDVFKETGITRRDFIDFKLKVHENIISKLQEHDGNKLYNETDPNSELKIKNPFIKRNDIWNHIEEQNPYLFLNNDEDQNNNSNTNFINIGDFTEMDNIMLNLINKEIPFEKLHRVLKEENNCCLYDINDLGDNEKEICYTFQTPSVQTYFLYIPIKVIKTNEGDNIRNPIIQLLAYFYLIK